MQLEVIGPSLLEVQLELRGLVGLHPGRRVVRRSYFLSEFLHCRGAVHQHLFLAVIVLLDRWEVKNLSLVCPPIECLRLGSSLHRGVNPTVRLRYRVGSFLGGQTQWALGVVFILLGFYP